MKPAHRISHLLLKLSPISIGLVAILFVSKHILLFSDNALSGKDPYDFPNYYFSGLRLLEGRPIYDYLNQELLAKFGWTYNTYMADPPFTVMILSPLSLLSYPTAWWSFLILSLTAISISLFWLLTKLGQSYSYAFSATSLVLASQSALYLFKRNHLEWMLFLGLSLCVVLFERRNHRAAAIVLGLISAVKLFPALILLICSRRLGAYNFLIGCLVMLTLSVCGVLICDLGDPSLANLKQYLSEVLSRSTNWLGTAGNFSLRSFWVALGNPPLSLNPYYVVSASTIVVATLATGSSKTTPSSTILLTATAAALLLSPLAWLNYLILLVPGVAYFYHQHHKKDPKRAHTLLLLVALALYWPTYIELANPTFSVLVSLLPTGILFYLVIEPYIKGSR